MYRNKLLIISLIIVISFGTTFSQQPYFIEKSPLKGEGIYAFLRRYNLDDNSCHLNKFLKLNNIDKNTHLNIDKDYKLPILIYQYNGKSIRTTIGNNDYQLAVRIQKYNEFLLKNNLRKTKYTESKILWVRYGDLNCPDNIAPLEKEEKITNNLGYKTEPLFGKTYEEVTIKDKSLQNRVFYITAGHGGPDPGARYVHKDYTLCEDEYAYDVSLRLARNLMEHSATVYIIIQDPNDGIRDEKYFTCDKDEKSINNKSLPLNQVQRLKQRTDDVNKLYRKHKAKGVKSQMFVAIHVDARSTGKRQDVFFYHYSNSRSGKKAALSVQKVFETKYRQVQKGREYHGTVTSRDLYVLKNTLPSAIYIELGNIKNTFNQKRLIISNNRQALANWIYLGLENTYK